MILCSDFDGTLRDPGDPTVLKTNLEALKDWGATGNHACLITGRNHSVLPIILPDWQNYFDYIATDNGGAIFNRSDKLVVKYPFPNGVITNILNDVAKNILPVFYYPDSFTTSYQPYSHPIKLRLWFHNLDALWAYHQNYSSNFPDVKSLPWPKPGFSPLPGVDLSQYHGFIDLVPRRSGKEYAVQYFAKVFRTADLITVGDGYNDIAMLEKFKGYAINTAPAEVLQATSGRIINSVSELISLKLAQSK